MPRKRLSDSEAKSLGLKLNPKREGRNKSEYRISEEQWNTIKTHKQETVSSSTETNDYNKESFVLNAFSSGGKMMNINEYCDTYSLPREDISSYKLVSHTGVPYYNIVFKENVNENEFDLEGIRLVLNNEIKKTYSYKKTPSTLKTEGVVKWSDLHFGAHIRNLIKTADYDSNVLLDGLIESVNDANNLGFSKTHIHINGDLIESFSGLNHINSWMSLDKNEVGSNSIMLCCEMIEKALSKVNNLGCIKIVAGNHDRISKDNKEDVKGGAAELIAWGLTLKGFDVEFNPMIITHMVNGINHINLHGHLGISKRSTEYIILNYGKQGVYNLICEAHLHSLMETLSVKQRSVFKMVSDDSIDYRRMHLQSFFTGNYYSETLGYTTNAGYSIFWDNGKGKPKHLNACR